MLTNTPLHPSLRNKIIKGTANIWGFSINKNYRCIYKKEKKCESNLFPFYVLYFIYFSAFVIILIIPDLS